MGAPCYPEPARERRRQRGKAMPEAGNGTTHPQRRLGQAASLLCWRSALWRNVATILPLAALVVTGQASAQEGGPVKAQEPASAIAAPFKQWWEVAYKVRDDGLLDIRERREFLVGSQSMVQALGQQRLPVNEHFFDLEIVE